MTIAGEPFDLLVIGAGINGAGIARDASGQGMRVLLVEQGDLAGATSSASSKLIHGGLRYLEQYEFRLVREALEERERLLAIAPHIIRPMRFVLPHHPAMRPHWMIAAGLFLYDHLSHRKVLGASHSVNFEREPQWRGPLSQTFTHGFSYADCWVDDARLVLLNAQDAVQRGAKLALHTRFVRASVKADGRWEAELQPVAGGEAYRVRARAVVNAAGPWVAEALGQLGVSSRSRVRWVKGSHLVVPRLPGADRAYILQMPDQRVVFILPFEEHFSLIGTTDVACRENPGEVAITPEEARYLCDGVNAYLSHAIRPEDAVWSYAGVRSLYDDGEENPSELTRDYVLELSMAAGAPVLSVFGGKLTTYRRLAEHALAKLFPALKKQTKSWTHTARLPGGDLPSGGLTALHTMLARHKPWMDSLQIQRIARTYGTVAASIFPSDRARAGEELAPGVFACELAHAKTCEWARSAEDFLWRRTKWGIHLTPEQRLRVEEWFSRA